MPADSLVLNRLAKKQLNKLPFKIHERIIAIFTSIKANPLIGSRLSGELGGYYKFRIGDYRIVYKFDAKSRTVEILKIEHRQGVYK